MFDCAVRTSGFQFTLQQRFGVVLVIKLRSRAPYLEASLKICLTHIVRFQVYEERPNDDLSHPTVLHTSLLVYYMP